MQAMRSMLERELWKRLPMATGSLPDLSKAMEGAAFHQAAASESPAGGSFEHWAERGNPWSASSGTTSTTKQVSLDPSHPESDGLMSAANLARWVHQMLKTPCQTLALFCCGHGSSLLRLHKSTGASDGSVYLASALWHAKMQLKTCSLELIFSKALLVLRISVNILRCV